MARTKKNGVEIIHKRRITQSETEESEEEQQKQRKVFKKNHVYHVSGFPILTLFQETLSKEASPVPSN